MSTLIAYASKSGAAQKCAELLSERIPSSQVYDLSQGTPDLAGFDTVILGSGVRASKIYKPLTKFMEENLNTLLTKKVAIYLCNSLPNSFQDYIERNFPSKLVQNAVSVLSFGGRTPIVSKETDWVMFENMEVFVQAVLAHDVHNVHDVHETAAAPEPDDTAEVAISPTVVSGQRIPAYYTDQDTDMVEAHIHAHFGEYESVFHELVSPDIHVDICMIEPRLERNCYTLVTLGMGAYRMNVPKELSGYKLERAELLIDLPADWRLLENEDEAWYWPFRWLKMLARHPGELDTWLGHGHTIASEEPLGPNNEFVGMLLTLPYIYGPKSSSVILPGGEVVRFYQVLPIYQSEMDFKLANSAEALEELFPEGFDMVVDINRKSFV